MPGMLSEAQNTQPSSGPGPQTPPAGNPGAGTPLPGSAGGPGQPAPQGKPEAPDSRTPGPNDPQKVEALKAQAVQRLYGENFDGMIEMFQTNGPENFAKSMAIAVNSTLEFLENQHGMVNHKMAAEVGMDVMMKLLEDVIAGGILPDVKLEQVQQAIPAILVMYADSHPDVGKEDIQQLMAYVESEVMAQEGGAAPAPGPNAPLSTGPGPEPSGSPVPPGAMV